MVRDNKLIGAMLLGDVSKVGFLSQAFDDKVPLPDERISMLFDIRNQRCNGCRGTVRRRGGA